MIWFNDMWYDRSKSLQSVQFEIFFNVPNGSLTHNATGFPHPSLHVVTSNPEAPIDYILKGLLDREPVGLQLIPGYHLEILHMEYLWLLLFCREQTGEVHWNITRYLFDFRWYDGSTLLLWNYHPVSSISWTIISMWSRVLACEFQKCPNLVRQVQVYIKLSYIIDRLRLFEYCIYHPLPFTLSWIIRYFTPFRRSKNVM